MTSHRPSPGIVDSEQVLLYRTKDFRGEPMGDGGYKIVGSHPRARGWLRENAGNGFRKQFIDESGYLRAEDGDELQALITQLQAEHG